jgi:hypothetical protein
LILTTYCKSKRKPIIALKIVIIEMKQTAAMSLGILGLNEDFVQLNEIMTIFFKAKIDDLILKKNLKYNTSFGIIEMN